MKRLFTALFPLILCLAVLSACTKGKNNTEDSGNGDDRQIFATDSGSCYDPENFSESSPADISPELSAFYDRLANEHCDIGAAFIGRTNSTDSKEEIRRLFLNKGYIDSYPFMGYIFEDDIVLCGGTEVYAVVPKNERCALTVYRSVLSETGKLADDLENPVYKGQAGKPIIISCNAGETYPDVLVTAETDKDTYSFRPFLSGQDEKLDCPDGCLDFSIYYSDDVEIAKQILFEYTEVEQAIKSGMTLMYLGERDPSDGHGRFFFALASGQGDQLVKEKFYSVGDNSVYIYDPMNDSWSTLGMG